ncbi:hypothetical protein O3M35_011214 [Rhynocoris fuscipes]|uniref:C2H2-type domain-containing protein n=1 Tax=Rhynocoris fuscipes TaxID=488301 RepID=A0AAW1CVT2_9HEMI
MASSCNLRCSSHGALYNHVTYNCGKEAQFQCPYCPYKGKQKVQVRRHIVYKHPLMVESSGVNQANVATYECPKCGKIYRSQGGLCNHVSFECGKDAQFKCQFCSYKTKMKGNFKRHIFVKHPDLFTDWKLPEALMFKSYPEYVQLILEGKRYFCNGCGKSYATSCGLKTHTKWECGKEPNFSCPHCTYRTKRKGSLKRHILTLHTSTMNLAESSKDSSSSSADHAHIKHQQDD